MIKKKLQAILCSMILVFSLAACGTSSTSQTTSAKKASSASVNTSAAVQKAETTVAASAQKGTTAVAGYVPKGQFNIRVFVGAGGIADTITRIMAQGLQKDGATAIVNNMPGASGSVAAADLNSHKPSINELAVVSMSLFTMAPIMNPQIKANIDDYEIVGSLIRDEFVLLVSSKSGIKNWDDLVKYGKEKQIIYASNTPGGGTHIVQTALFGAAGLNAQALTSDASNKDILAVMSGDAICTSATISLAKTYVDSGDLIPIGVFSDESYKGYNGFEVPTMKSYGYDVTVPSYNFIITRSGVDKAQVDGLYKAILAYRETDEFKKAAAGSNYTPDTTDGEKLKSEIKKYAAICQDIYDKYYKK